MASKPGPVPVPDGFACHTVGWNLDGDPEPMQVLVATDWTGNSALELQQLANDVYDAFAVTMVGASSDLTLAYVRSEGMSGVIEYQAEHNENTVGGEAFAAASPNVALLIQKRTGISGRANRGRMYMPGGYLPEGAVTSAGYLTGTLQADWQVAFNNLYNAPPWADATGWYIIHGAKITSAPGVLPKVYQDPPYDAPHQMTAFVVDNQVATQRRRLR